MISKTSATVLIFLFARLMAYGQTNPEQLHNLLKGIDHVPIVVPDLNVAKALFSQQLKFIVKNGRVHEGINNFFIKFHDGTYLEFLTPVDSTFIIGNYYTGFLSKRSGATSVALSVTSADSIAGALQRNQIPFKSDSNPIWRSVEPSDYNLFYIEYLNKNWKEREENTTHANQSLSLKEIWWVSQQPDKDIDNFTKLGFINKGVVPLLDINVKLLQVGTERLVVVDREDAGNILANFKSPQTDGIFGFGIQVKSLSAIRKLLNDQKLIMKDNHLIYNVKEYNFFIVFSE